MELPRELEAVGVHYPDADATYILRCEALGNMLAEWLGQEMERTVNFGPAIRFCGSYHGIKNLDLDFGPSK